MKNDAPTAWGGAMGASGSSAPKGEKQGAEFLGGQVNSD